MPVISYRPPTAILFFRLEWPSTDACGHLLSVAQARFRASHPQLPYYTSKCQRMRYFGNNVRADTKQDDCHNYHRSASMTTIATDTSQHASSSPPCDVIPGCSRSSTSARRMLDHCASTLYINRQRKQLLSTVCTTSPQLFILTAAGIVNLSSSATRLSRLAAELVVAHQAMAEGIEGRTWPKWPPQFLHRISVLSMPMEPSVIRSTVSGRLS